MKSLRFLGNEILLGTLIALLSIFTAFASWQGSIADSKQSEHELLAMQDLNDGNAEYLSPTLRHTRKCHPSFAVNGFTQAVHARSGQ